MHFVKKKKNITNMTWILNHWVSALIDKFIVKELMLNLKIKKVI